MSKRLRDLRLFILRIHTLVGASRCNDRSKRGRGLGQRFPGMQRKRVVLTILFPAEDEMVADHASGGEGRGEEEVAVPAADPRPAKTEGPLTRAAHQPVRQRNRIPTDRVTARRDAADPACHKNDVCHPRRAVPSRRAWIFAAPLEVEDVEALRRGPRFLREVREIRSVHARGKPRARAAKEP